MIINELPDRIIIQVEDEEENKMVPVEATVIFISEKLVPTEIGGAEDFVVMCYTADKKVHEVHLNTVKIISTKKYEERKIGTQLHPPSKRRRTRRRKKDIGGDNNSKHEGGNQSERESSPSRDRGEDKTDGGKGG